MHIYILGIGGTFMGSLALLASEQGHRVTGFDQGLYPPMSTLLAEQGITVDTEFSPENFSSRPDCVVIGNVFSRGHPAVEWVLNEDLPYMSGPQWLASHVLQGRKVICVAGTHGKTTTSSMIAWLLEQAGHSPGFFIGGLPHNFNESARLGTSPWFVLESDEYDSAFFDKRSKFLHYSPDILLINNIEFDHADIFQDLGEIQRQFAYLLRNVKSDGTVIYPEQDQAIAQVMAQGCWSKTLAVGDAQSACSIASQDKAGQRFALRVHGKRTGTIQWSHLGQHNLENALIAAAAGHEAGLSLSQIAEGLHTFKGVKRRLDCVATINGVTIYDDFAHHPTAIAKTLAGLKAQLGDKTLKVIFQFASNSMQQGSHNQALVRAFNDADRVYCLQPEVAWDSVAWQQRLSIALDFYKDWAQLIDQVVDEAKSGDHIVLMTNRDSDTVCQLLLGSLQQAQP